MKDEATPKRAAIATLTPRPDVRALNDVQEQTRRWIANALFASLSATILVAVVGLVIGRLSVIELKDLFASLNFGPLICLAMGFYFGRVRK